MTTFSERKQGMDPTYPALSEAIEAFRESLLAKSQHTASTYSKALRRLEEFIGEAGLGPGSLSTDQLPPDLLERFYTWLLKTYGRSRWRTAATYVAGVRAFVRFLDRRRWLGPGLSYERMKDNLKELMGRHPYPTPRVDDAIAAVVTYVKSVSLPPSGPRHRQLRLTLLRDRAILLTLWATGMRRAELASLNRTDIQDGYSIEGLITGKGGKERVVFFDEESLHAIRRYLEERDDPYFPLFIRHDDGRGAPGPRGERWRLSPHSIWAVVKRHGKAAGVEVTTHHLRHLKARVMLNSGAKLEEVQDILGHASPDTTKRIYAPYSKQHLMEVARRYSRSPEEVLRRSYLREAAPRKRSAEPPASKEVGGR